MERGKWQQLIVQLLICIRPGPHLEETKKPSSRQVAIQILLDYHQTQRPHFPEAVQGLYAISPRETFDIPRPSAEFEDTESNHTQAMDTMHDHMQQMKDRDIDMDSRRTDTGTLFRTGPRSACP